LQGNEQVVKNLNPSLRDDEPVRALLDVAPVAGATWS
jgi:hypothetical protein